MTKFKIFGFFDFYARTNKTKVKLELSELKRDVPHPMEQNILHYLNGGHFIAYELGVVKDFLNQQEGIVLLGPYIYTDGTWVWSSDVMYYVEKYHIQLPDDFLAHMAKNKWQCPKVKAGKMNNFRLNDIL